jgi:hypothetical protein
MSGQSASAFRATSATGSSTGIAPRGVQRCADRTSKATPFGSTGVGVGASSITDCRES